MLSVGTVTMLEEPVSTSSERPGLVPVTPNTMYFSRSASVSWYESRVAPAMAVQPSCNSTAALTGAAQRYQAYVSVGAGVPIHVPTIPVSREPRVAVPVRDGATVLPAGTVIWIVAGLADAVEPAALVAVSRTRM